MTSQTVIRVIIVLALAGSAAALQLPPSSGSGPALALPRVSADTGTLALPCAPAANRFMVGTAGRTPAQITVHRLTP